MRVALFADIHANREAFEACIVHAATENVERYVFLGDYVGYGADPGWVLDTVMRYVALGAIAIRGNHDDAVLNDQSGMNGLAQTAIEWTRAQLNDAQRAFLDGLPMQHVEGPRLFVHASANEPTAWHYVAGDASVATSLAATECRQTFCGHVHIQQIYRENESGEIVGGSAPSDQAFPLLAKWRWVSVMGAVGQPRDENPNAAYAVLDEAENMLTFRRVPYDIGTASAKVRAAGLPKELALRLRMGM